MTATHLVIASAAPARPGTTPLPKLPPLPHLSALIAQLQQVARLRCEPDSPDTPFERMLAQLHGLAPTHAPGRVPWAAFDTQTTGAACAWIRPCHLQLGMDSARVMAPADLAMQDEEAHALLATLAPYAQEDGMDIRPIRADAWLARSPLFDGIQTSSILRASQQPLSAQAFGVSGTANAAVLRRLQNEWQMLLADHAVNRAREDDGRPTINALWIEGAGILQEPLSAHPGIHAEWALVHAGDDIDARARAWQAIDVQSVAPLAAQLAAGVAIRLTLCGPTQAITLAPRRGWQRLAALWQRPLALDALRSEL